MRRGFIDHAPFFASVLIWGAIFGAAATVAGLPGWYSVLMSVTVFSGAAQLAILKVAHAGVFGIFVTSLLVSIRFVPIVLALSPRLGVSRWRRAGVVAGIVDAGFALASRRPADDELPGYVLGTTISAYSAWIIGTIAGVILGPVIPQGWAAVTDGVIVVIFMGLTIEVVENRWAAFAAVLAAATAALLGRVLPLGLALAIAALVAGTVFLPFARERE